MSKKIVSIHVRRNNDMVSDGRHLGEYANFKDPRPGPAIVIDRVKEWYRDGYLLPHEFRYFHAANVSNMKEARQNYRRSEALNNAQWYYIGIQVVAEIDVNGQCITIKSPGLWGVESDSGLKHHREVAEDEYEILKSTLKELGFREFPPLAI